MYMYKENQKIFKNIIAITNRHLCKRPFLEQVERVCCCKPKAIVLREKDLSENEYYMIAKEVTKICKLYNVPYIFHTYLNTAKEMNCTAIHLPFSLLQKYYNQLKNFTIIGTSVHSIEEALKSEKLGATYITAGHIYNTDCKKGIPPKGIEFLKEICENVSLPVYGIGGIKLNESQLKEILNCGAKGACIMSNMMEI